jgi:hypothetical protein
MAEALALAASIAGLTSLAFQLVDGVNGLRKRSENLEKLRQHIAGPIDILEAIRDQLCDVDVDQLQGPLDPLVSSRARCKEILARLYTLREMTPMPSTRLSKRHALRALLMSKKWRTETDELKVAATELKLDIIL